MNGILVSILKFVQDIFSNATNKSLRNSFQDSMNILSKAQTADINLSWYRNMLGVLLGGTFLLYLLVLIFRFVLLAFSSGSFADEAAIQMAETFKGMLRTFLGAPFIVSAVAVLAYVSDFTSRVLVAMGSLFQPKGTHWQVTILNLIQSADIGTRLANWGLGWMLKLEISPFPYLVYLFTALLIATAGLWASRGSRSVLFIFVASILVTCIVSKPVMLLVMSVSGSVVANNPQISNNGATAGIVLGMLAFAPPTIFFVTLFSLITRRQSSLRAVRVTQQAQRSASSSSQGAKRHDPPVSARDVASAGVGGALGTAALEVSKHVTKTIHPAAGAATLVAMKGAAHLMDQVRSNKPK